MSMTDLKEIFDLMDKQDWELNRDGGYVLMSTTQFIKKSFKSVLKKYNYDYTKQPYYAVITSYDAETALIDSIDRFGIKKNSYNYRGKFGPFGMLYDNDCSLNPVDEHTAVFNSSYPPSEQSQPLHGIQRLRAETAPSYPKKCHFLAASASYRDSLGCP